MMVVMIPIFGTAQSIHEEIDTTASPAFRNAFPCPANKTPGDYSIQRRNAFEIFTQHAWTCKESCHGLFPIFPCSITLLVPFSQLLGLSVWPYMPSPQQPTITLLLDL